MSKSGTLTVAVTGAGGQLGGELTRLSSLPGVRIIGLDRGRLDITCLERCRETFKALLPDAVIHCAAYTAVDKAESEPEEAFRVNGTGTGNVAMAARECGAKLCYISTDYVFDGTADRPYVESDLVRPLTVYGQSKLDGERAVQRLMDRYFIVRTSWVFGRYGANFVKTMLQLAGERDRLKVVDDQYGSPTYTYDLALFLLQLLRTESYGVYHASNTGSCSWFEFAKAIFEESGITTGLEPCSTAEFHRPAPRPAYSVMAHDSIHRAGLTDLRPWREALQHFLKG